VPICDGSSTLPTAITGPHASVNRTEMGTLGREAEWSGLGGHPGGERCRGRSVGGRDCQRRSQKASTWTCHARSKFLLTRRHHLLLTGETAFDSFADPKRED
jgi:hypothetical protein